ncbi:MAG: GyrI-like domain-containing protein [Marinifilaceae bacterium]
MKTQNPYRTEYLQRINRVMDHIENNLDKELSLEIIAGVAHFSPYHFHRIFSSFTGEALNQFIKRKRIEKAGRLLLINPTQPIGEIACDCGFNSSAVFCRNFRNHFGMTTQEFRATWPSDFSKNHQPNGKNDQLCESSIAYICNVKQNEKWKNIMEQNIAIKEMPALNLIYIRHIGQFQLIGKAYEKLFNWAGPRGLINPPHTKGVTVYHDDPKITDLEKVQQSACITIEQDVTVEGEIGKMNLPANKCAVGSFEIGQEEFETAWSTTCGWVTENGYQPIDSAPYEIYYNDHKQHPEGKFIVDICIPVKPL